MRRALLGRDRVRGAEVVLRTLRARGVGQLPLVRARRARSAALLAGAVELEEEARAAQALRALRCAERRGLGVGVARSARAVREAALEERVRAHFARLRRVLEAGLAQAVQRAARVRVVEGARARGARRARFRRLRAVEPRVAGDAVQRLEVGLGAGLGAGRGARAQQECGNKREPRARCSTRAHATRNVYRQ